MRFSKIFRIRLGSRILASKIQFWNEELHTHYGITNETPDGWYIPFWDFIEDVREYEVRRTLEDVQDKECLSRIYIIQTLPKESYRAISFDKVYWKEYISILAQTDLIDMSYLKHSVMRGRAVIRVSEKNGTHNKIVDEIYDDRYDWDNTSNHHQAFLSTIYPEIPPPKEVPKPIQVRVSKYESFR